MNSKPILFQGWKVRKILDWDWNFSNMHTRRLLKKQPLDILPMKVPNMWVTLRTKDPEPHGDIIRCRFGVPGDLLWVREALSVEKSATRAEIETGHFTYKADDKEGLWTKENGFRTVSPIHMQKWQARIWLNIVSVKVERIQDIVAADVLREGLGEESGNFRSIPQWKETQRKLFWGLWDQINGKRYDGLYTWERNPFVWVIEFDRRQS